MKKICDLISFIIFKVDTVLYKTFGIVSSFRRDAWKLQGRRLQVELDAEHARRDHLNALHGTSYTTKRAIALQED